VIPSESAAFYQIARSNIEEQGFKVLAIVLDGKHGIREVFLDIPVQMCHFHQKAIVTRYITTRPNLEAGKELKKITGFLGQFDEETFIGILNDWHIKWSDFLKEKTIDSVTGKWHFTHRRLRAAYRSLKTNLPYLFTYRKHPELEIPNTTNSLEGTFSHLKDLITIHRGLKADLKLKLINQILSK
jgi:hypothetical protein